MNKLNLTGLFFLFFILGLHAQPLTPTQKAYGLAQLWHEAEKNFVYFDQVPNLNWDSTFQVFLPIVQETTSDYLYYKELQRFYSLLNDGHTRAYVPYKLRKIYEVSTPITTELIEDKVIITKILNDTLIQDGLQVGMQIIAIDGKAVQSYAAKRIQPYVFYSTTQDRNVQVFEKNLLKGPIDSLLSLTIQHNGKTQEFIISRKMSKKKIEKNIFEYKVLEGNIGYLKINQFWGKPFYQEFDSIYTHIKKSSKLIIDVSDNIGGNTHFVNYILRHFIRRPSRSSRWKSPEYVPAYASWGIPQEWSDHKGNLIWPRLKRYRKKVVLLISEKTYSAGEDFVSTFTNASNGQVIGRSTAGTTGNPIGFPLFDSGFQICSKRDYLANGKEFVGYGIQPDIYVPKSINEKLLISKALEILK